MSTHLPNTRGAVVQPAIQARTTASPAGRKGLAGVRAFVRKAGRAPWAFADQALISGSNFFTMILLGRQLSANDYGEFAQVYACLLLVNSLQAGPITTAHNVLGVARRGREYLDYTTSTAYSQLAFALIASALATLATVGAWGFGVRPQIVTLLGLLIPSIFAWQLQEFSRRVLYSERRMAAAFFNDLVGYGGQSVGIAILLATDSLSATRAMLTLMISSALAAGVGAWQLRGSLKGRFDWSYLRENWVFGRWLVGVNLVGSWLANEVYFHLTGFLLGGASVGILRAAHTIFGPTRVLSYMLSSLLPIHLSRTLAEQGDHALDTSLKRFLKTLIPLLGAYCLLIALFAGPVLTLFYRNTYDDGRAILVLYCILTFLIFINMTIDAALLAKRLSPKIFANQLRANLLILPFGCLAVRFFGAHGAVLSMITTNLVLSFLSWRIYRQSLREPAGVVSGDRESDEPGPVEWTSSEREGR